MENVKFRTTNISENFKNTENLKLFLPLIFCFALFLIYFRSAYALSSEVLFTEDGKWLGQMYKNGFWHTLMNAKGEYLVFGNIIALKIADMLNWLYAGKDLTYIPFFVAVVQYMLYAFCAILPVFCFKKRISFLSRMFCYFMILVLPLGRPGESDHEIFGKISNIGFIFYFIAFALLVYRMDNKEEISPLRFIFLDFMIFLCPTTNPSAYLLVFIFFIVDVITYFKNNKEKSLKENIISLFKTKWFIHWVILGVLLVIAALYTVTQLTMRPSATISAMPWDFKRIVELVARQVIYPFIFKFWELFNVNIALSITVIFFALIITRIIFFLIKRKHKESLFYILAFIAAIIYTVLMMIQRPTLLQLQRSFESTFPDRYYYTQNIMWICCFTIFLEPYNIKRKIINIIPAIIVVFFMCQYLYGFNQIFRINTSSVSGKFQDSVRKSFVEDIRDEENTGYRVYINPTDWSMWISEEQMNATILNRRGFGEDENLIVPSSFTDDNWNNGVLNGASIILFENKYANNQCLSNAKFVVADGVEIPVLNYEIKDQNWSWLTVDTYENAVKITSAIKLDVTK